MPIVGAIMGWIVPLLPVIWWFARKALPRLVPALVAMMGKGGVIAAILGAIVGIYKWVKHLSIVLLAIKLGSGPLGKIFSAIRWILNVTFKFPVIMGLTLVLSQVFPGLLERIFLIVGALSVKIGLVIFGNVMDLINDSAENNMDQLNTIVGSSVDQLPPCLVDVMTTDVLLKMQHEVFSSTTTSTNTSSNVIPKRREFSNDTFNQSM